MKKHLFLFFAISLVFGPLLHQLHGLLADLSGPPRHWLPGGDWQGGVVPGNGQNHPQGRLRHLQLLPDGSQSNSSPPELHCSPFGVSFEIFFLSVTAECP